MNETGSTDLGRQFSFLVLLLLGIGLVMVASSSMPIAQARLGDPFYYLTRQTAYLWIGLTLAWLIYQIPTDFWERMPQTLFLFTLCLLALILVPGIGTKVNGSLRWIRIGPVGLQVSELAKLLLIIFYAWYLSEHAQALQRRPLALVRALIPLMLVAFLILMQPDFGAVVVLSATIIGMLFMAGVPLWQFILLCVCAAGAMAGLAFSAPYRFERLVAFMNPWADQFDSGYQLTQSLIAFGRGAWFGVGLGGGLQKLHYLPEAHTDFIFAVIAEEFGLVGAAVVLLLYVLLTLCGLRIGMRALQQGRQLGGFLATGLSLWLGMQALIAMGVNMGLLPTKGLTLPLISSGGSSLVITFMAIALILRVNQENVA